jgi:hypothetical protein
MNGQTNRSCLNARVLNDMLLTRLLFAFTLALTLITYSHAAQPPANHEEGQLENSKQAAPAEDVKVDRDVLGGVEDKAPVRSANENYYEAQAYNYLLVKSHKASSDSLNKAARRDMTFAHLFEEPEKYRGEIVHLEGTLKRLRRFDAPSVAAKDGVPQLYEGWIFTDSSFNNPCCVILSELHPDIHVGEKVEIPVVFDGYFFKRYRYKAVDGHWRDAPLLIGKELRLSPSAASSREDEAFTFAHLFLPAFLAVLCGTAGLALGLLWWFRRGDRHVHAGLYHISDPLFPEPDNADRTQAQ